MPYEDPDPSSAGKRSSRPSVATVGTSSSSSSSSALQPSTKSIFERNLGRHFSIDSGGDESVFPASSSDRSSARSQDLIAANGSTIRTYGRRSLSVSFSSRHQTDHSFWIAEVSKPLLGASFFRENGLLIDIPRLRLTSQSMFGVYFPAVSTNTPGVYGLRLPTAGPYKSILEQYPSLLTPQFKGEVKHKTVHYIPTSGSPLHARPRRLEGTKLQIAKEEFLKIERLGIV